MPSLYRLTDRYSPRPLLCTLLILCLAITGTAHAGNNRVEALIMPAWLERDGQRLALQPGMDIHSGDLIVSGEQARVYLLLDDGSRVKLGEQARLRFQGGLVGHLKVTQPASADTGTDSSGTLRPRSTLQKTGPIGIFQASLEVLRGAFRFTTTAMGKNRQRAVDVRLGTITIGIRGTDIWGRSRDGEDLFALLEGRVSVQRAQEASFDMHTPLHYIVAREGQATSTVTPIDSGELALWAAETEIEDGSGVIRDRGDWALTLMSLQNADSARRLQAELTQAGYACSIETVQLDTQFSRLQLQGFASREDALAFARRMQGRFGIDRAWVSRIAGTSE